MDAKTLYNLESSSLVITRSHNLNFVKHLFSLAGDNEITNETAKYISSLTRPKHVRPPHYQISVKEPSEVLVTSSLHHHHHHQHYKLTLPSHSSQDDTKHLSPPQTSYIHNKEMSFLGHPFRLLVATVQTFAITHLVYAYGVGIGLGVGPSMLPTFLVANEWFVTDRRYRRGRGVRVGDCVVYAIPVKPGQEGVKRVMGMPGDYVLLNSPPSSAVLAMLDGGGDGLGGGGGGGGGIGADRVGRGVGSENMIQVSLFPFALPPLPSPSPCPCSCVSLDLARSIIRGYT